MFMPPSQHSSLHLDFLLAPLRRTLNPYHHAGTATPVEMQTEMNVAIAATFEAESARAAANVTLRHVAFHVCVCEGLSRPLPFCL